LTSPPAAKALLMVCRIAELTIAESTTIFLTLLMGISVVADLKGA
jgi:hypothetical protein